MVIRAFVEADRAEVVSLWQQLFADDPPWNEPNQVIDTKLSVQPELFLVCEQEQSVVGTVLAGFDGVRGWLHHIAVLPRAQGQGVSRKLIEHAEQLLKQMGCVKVNLQVRSANQTAAEKYMHMGFVEEDRRSFGKLLVDRTET